MTSLPPPQRELHSEFSKIPSPTVRPHNHTSKSKIVVINSKKVVYIFRLFLLDFLFFELYYRLLEFGVYTNSPSFDFALNPTYQLTVQCDDNTGNTPTAVLSVDILDGDKITFTNIPGNSLTNANSIPPLPTQTCTMSV